MAGAVRGIGAIAMRSAADHRRVGAVLSRTAGRGATEDSVQRGIAGFRGGAGRAVRRTGPALRTTGTQIEFPHVRYRFDTRRNGSRE